MKDLKFKKGKYRILINRYGDRLYKNVIEIEGYINEKYQIGIRNSFAIEKACPELKQKERYWVIDDLYSGYNFTTRNTKKECVAWINQSLDNPDFKKVLDRYQTKRDEGHKAITKAITFGKIIK